MDRLQIEITGELPDEGKYAILADAEAKANALVAELEKSHKMELSVTVKAVRPSAKKAAVPVVRPRVAAE